MTTTAARAPWHLWCALAACIVSTAISVHAAWNADTLPVTLVYAAMAALTAVIAVWGCRVVAAYRRDAADLDVCSYWRSHEAADIEGWTYAMQRALDKND